MKKASRAISLHDDDPHPSRRADVALVARGLADSRAKAQEAIEAGLVTVDGRAVRRPSDRVPPDAVLAASPPYPWVSRGGVKLAAALDHFSIDPSGLSCLDVGASTGGFTDVLLARGAERVFAVDVGRGQLHPRIAADLRVRALDGTDIRALDPGDWAGAAELVTVDVSFISLALVVPALARWTAPGAALVLLVKPQFECGRERLGRGGIVRDPAVRSAVVSAVEDLLAGLGYRTSPAIASPITGGDGNEEFLLAAHRG